MPYFAKLKNTSKIPYTANGVQNLILSSLSKCTILVLKNLHEDPFSSFVTYFYLLTKTDRQTPPWRGYATTCLRTHIKTTAKLGMRPGEI